MTALAEHGGIAALVAVMVPLAAALWLGIRRRQSRHSGLAVVLGASVVALVLTALLVAVVRQGQTPTLMLAAIVPPVRIAFRVDAFGALFALTVAGLFVSALIFAVGYFRDDERQWRFYAFASACLGCMLGVAFAANLLTLLAFYELFSLLSYPLIVHDRTPAAFAAGLKYIAYILGGSALILVGLVLVYHLADSVGFVPGGILTESHVPAATPRLLLVTLACLVSGFGVKAAIMPLHGWVPDAHPAAPAPFSAVLSGVMVAAGAFAIVRVLFEVFGADLLSRLGAMPWLSLLAALSVIVAAMLAIGEQDLKRRLAYSTISQMAYVPLAASVLHPDALAGGLLHISHHALLKGGLFFCAGLIAVNIGATRIGELRGLARLMPLTALAMTVLAAGLVGVPPLSGFLSKWLLGRGLLAAGGTLELAILFAGALLAAVYLWPLVFLAWLPAAPSRRALKQDIASRWMTPALVAVTLLSALLGVAAFLPGFPMELAQLAAAELIGVAR